MKAIFAAGDSEPLTVEINKELSEVVIDEGGNEWVMQLPPKDVFPTLQVSEALQFTADVLGATVPGRLSAFERGFQSASADVNHLSRTKGWWIDPECDSQTIRLAQEALEDAKQSVSQDAPEELEAKLAEALIHIMNLAHEKNLLLAKRIQALLP